MEDNEATFLCFERKKIISELFTCLKYISKTKVNKDFTQRIKPDIYWQQICIVRYVKVLQKE